LCDAIGIDVLDGLQSLVEKSLLRQRADVDGEPRFWMLETIREYAVELLASAGTLEEARRAHADWFLGLAEHVDLESRTGDQAALFDQLDADNDNLRAAIDWTEETSDGESMLRLATALWGFWATRGHIAEGTAVLENALALSGKRPAPALLGLCTLRNLRGDAAGLEDDIREALRACEELGDPYSLAQAWNLRGQFDGSVLGRLAAGEESWRHALRYAEHGGFAAEKAESVSWLLISAIFGPLPVEEGIARCAEFAEASADEPETQAFCSSGRAVLEAMRGDFETARELVTSGRRLLQELGLPVWVAITAQEAFFVEMLAGDPGAAAAILRESNEALVGMGERSFRSTIAGLLAQTLCALGEDEEAERFSRECAQ